ncbi:MAG: tRNA pseudouridine(38-40) synthase TruA [Treponema sp.]|nr:tRNA pseudouridine(38-40) synthase TruA [Treponema sp.]
MRNILLTVSYDGTNFSGWQRQDKSDEKKPVRTVQGELEKVLESVHKTKINLQGSGRTDSGVHAVRQKANFLSPIDSIPAEKYVVALNSLLPDDIRILDSKEVDENFSSRFSAVTRTYRYFIVPSNRALATQMPYVWNIKNEPDIEKLNAMASVLKGELNFATFTAAGDQSKSTFRYVENARFFYEDLCPCGKAIVFEITANAFLWKIVRSLTGSMIFFEKNGYDEKYFKEVLDSCDRSKAGPTAPPQGLFLWDISYEGVRHDADYVKENSTED